jgi:uncharacterized protein
VYLTPRLLIREIGPNRHVVCNAHTGEILLTSDHGMRLLDALRSGEDVPLALQDDLLGRQFLFADEEEEERSFAALCRRAEGEFQRQVPRHYTFIINAHCNFACAYCFEAAWDTAPMTLTAPQVDAALRILDHDRARHDSLLDVEIFGGEPMLPGSRGVLDHLLRGVAARGGKTSVQSNGYFLADNLDFFRQHNLSIGQIQITLDGPRETHDRRRMLKGGRPTFDRIVAGIDALLAEGLPIRLSIRINVDRGNVDCLEAMAAFYAAKGWTGDSRVTFVAAPVDDRCGVLRDTSALLRWDQLFARVFPLSVDAGGGPFDLSVFKVASYFRHYFGVIRQSMQQGTPAQPLFIPKALYCEAAALKLFAFHPDGRIYPCPETVGRRELAIGTYWPAFSIDRRKARPWKRQTVLTRPTCRACAISTLCGGGCVLYALMQKGTMSEPVCDNAREILELYCDKLRPA